MALALSDAGADLEDQVSYWLDAKLMLAGRMAPQRTGSFDPEGHTSVRFDASRGIGAALRDWHAEQIEMKAFRWVDEVGEPTPDGLRRKVDEARARALPDRPLPGDTLGQGLSHLLDRLASPEGKSLRAALNETMAFDVTFAWGGHQPAIASVVFSTTVARCGPTGELTWHYVQFASQYKPTIPTIMRSPFRRAFSIPAFAFLRMAETWALTKAARAAADIDSSSVPPASGSADQPDEENPAPGSAGLSVASMGLRNANVHLPYQDTRAGRRKGRSRTDGRASAEQRGLFPYVVQPKGSRNARPFFQPDPN